MSDERINQLQTAVWEAKRFIDNANYAISTLGQEKGYVPSNKQWAAAKRSSMDLTMQLVRVRQARR